MKNDLQNLGSKSQFPLASTLAYDYENRLTQHATGMLGITVAHKYDGLGRLVRTDRTTPGPTTTQFEHVRDGLKLVGNIDATNTNTAPTWTNQPGALRPVESQQVVTNSATQYINVSDEISPARRTYNPSTSAAGDTEAIAAKGRLVLVNGSTPALAASLTVNPSELFSQRNMTYNENSIALPSDRGTLEISGANLMYEGARVKSWMLGRDVNPAGRGDGAYYAQGAFSIGSVRPSPTTTPVGGWGNSVNNGCGGCGFNFGPPLGPWNEPPVIPPQFPGMKPPPSLPIGPIKPMKPIQIRLNQRWQIRFNELLSRYNSIWERCNPDNCICNIAIVRKDKECDYEEWWDYARNVINGTRNNAAMYCCAKNPSTGAWVSSYWYGCNPANQLSACCRAMIEMANRICEHIHNYPGGAGGNPCDDYSNEPCPFAGEDGCRSNRGFMYDMPSERDYCIRGADDIEANCSISLSACLLRCSLVYPTGGFRYTECAECCNSANQACLNVANTGDCDWSL